MDPNSTKTQIALINNSELLEHEIEHLILNPHSLPETKAIDIWRQYIHTQGQAYGSAGHFQAMERLI